MAKTAEAARYEYIFKTGNRNAASHLWSSASEISPIFSTENRRQKVIMGNHGNTSEDVGKSYMSNCHLF